MLWLLLFVLFVMSVIHWKFINNFLYMISQQILSIYSDNITTLYLGTDHLTWRGMVFCFVQNLFFGLQKSSNIYLFFQNLTLGYMTKTLNQIFFFLHQNQNIFFSNIGNQNIFLEIYVSRTFLPLITLLQCVFVRG